MVGMSLDSYLKIGEYMSYVDSVLGKDESVEYEAVVSILPFFPRFILGLIFIAGGLFVFFNPIGHKILNFEIGKILPFALAILGLIIFSSPIIAKETTELVITNRRIIAKFGLISRYTIEINLSKIESISVSQSILGRFLNYGDLQIVGTGGTREPISFINEPLAFRRKVDEILNG